MKRANVSSASAICFLCWEFFILWSTSPSFSFPGLLCHTSLFSTQPTLPPPVYTLLFCIIISVFSSLSFVSRAFSFGFCCLVSAGPGKPRCELRGSVITNQNKRPRLNQRLSQQCSCDEPYLAKSCWESEIVFVVVFVLPPRPPKCSRGLHVRRKRRSIPNFPPYMCVTLSATCTELK